MLSTERTILNIFTKEYGSPSKHTTISSFSELPPSGPIPLTQKLHTYDVNLLNIVSEIVFSLLTVVVHLFSHLLQMVHGSPSRSILDSLALASTPLPRQKTFNTNGKTQWIHVMTKEKYYLAMRLECTETKHLP